MSRMSNRWCLFDVTAMAYSLMASSFDIVVCMSKNWKRETKKSFQIKENIFTLNSAKFFPQHFSIQNLISNKSDSNDILDPAEKCIWTSFYSNLTASKIILQTPCWCCTAHVNMSIEHKHPYKSIDGVSIFFSLPFIYLCIHSAYC